MPEWLIPLIGVAVSIGALFTPFVLAARARDKSLQEMVFAVKDDVMSHFNASQSRMHDRIDQVRTDYVRRDDLDGHVGRIEKRFDEVFNEMRRGNEATERKLDDIRNLLRPVVPPNGG